MGLINFFRNYYTAVRCSHLNKDRLLEIQNQRFRRLLRHAVNNSEFYQELYSGLDIDGCNLSDLPVVTKSAMMENFDHFITDSRLKLFEIQKWIADKKNYGKLYLDEYLPLPTSGSSGEYALVVYHREALDLIQASLLARHPLHTKRSLYDHTKMLATLLLSTKFRIAVISVPYGNFLPIAINAPPFHQLFAKRRTFSVLAPVEQTVAALNKFQPNCLVSNSFFLAILAQEQFAGRLNIAFRRPMSFLAGAAEPLTEHTKELALKAWNMEIQNDYGGVECYFMATSCQKFGRLHAMNDLCILEIVDADNKPVPQGECGEKVLVTNLANFIQPIIRYELEDVTGYAGHSCKCGLPFPTLLPVQGRKSDVLYFKKPKEGYEKFHPYRFRVPLYYAHELRQYQIVQTKRNELTFLYVSQNDGEGIEQQLRQILQEALGQADLQSRVTIKLKRVETIPRNERSGKFQIVKSLGAPSDLNTALDTRTDYKPSNVKKFNALWVSV